MDPSRPYRIEKWKKKQSRCRSKKTREAYKIFPHLVVVAIHFGGKKWYILISWVVGLVREP